MTARNNNDEGYYVEYTNQPPGIYYREPETGSYRRGNRPETHENHENDHHPNNDENSDHDDHIGTATAALHKVTLLAMKESGLHKETSCGGSTSSAEAKAAVFDDVPVLKDIAPLSVEASADYKHASAEAGANPLSANAGARAAYAKANANATLVDGFVEANADADFCKAEAGVEYSAAKLCLIDAKAGARVAKASAEIDLIPGANAHVSIAEAETRAGVSYDYTGAEIGASLAEAQAGPFAIRAGLKFGFAIKKGIPEVHAGPVSGCSLM